MFKQLLLCCFVYMYAVGSEVVDGSDTAVIEMRNLGIGRGSHNQEMSIVSVNDNALTQIYQHTLQVQISLNSNVIIQCIDEFIVHLIKLRNCAEYLLSHEVFSEGVEISSLTLVEQFNFFKKLREFHSIYNVVKKSGEILDSNIVKLLTFQEPNSKHVLDDYLADKPILRMLATWNKLYVVLTVIIAIAHFYILIIPVMEDTFKIKLI